MTHDDVFEAWLTERRIEDVEAFVPDMAGSARGKVVPAGKFGKGQMKMPESVFAQTVSGDYVKDPDNLEDRDMLLVPDPHTLRPVPWAADPAASVFLDCYHRDGSQDREDEDLETAAGALSATTRRGWWWRRPAREGSGRRRRGTPAGCRPQRPASRGSRCSSFGPNRVLAPER